MALFRTFSKIYLFLHITQKFNITNKMAGKRFFWGKMEDAFQHALCTKETAESLSHTILEINIFLCFTAF